MSRCVAVPAVMFAATVVSVIAPRTARAADDPCAVVQASLDSMKGVTCWAMREEAIDGEKATLYGVHATNAAGNTVDTQVWVSKTRALPIKELLTQPKDGQAHAMNIRLDYTNVKPPL